MTKSSEAATRWVVPDNLTNEQIADARRALEDLARLLGRVSAEACHKLGISFDMDDPQVARDVIKVTFDALVSSPPRTRKAEKSPKRPPPGSRSAPR